MKKCAALSCSAGRLWCSLRDTFTRYTDREPIRPKLRLRLRLWLDLGYSTKSVSYP